MSPNGVVDKINNQVCETRLLFKTPQRHTTMCVGRVIDCVHHTIVW